MSNYFKLGGISYDVFVLDVTESFEILYSSETGRTLANGAEMNLSPIGTFFNYEVTVKRRNGYEEEYDDLIDYLSMPRTEGIEVEIAHKQSTWKFMAYVSSGTRKLQKIGNDGKIYWGELTINIIPMKAQVEY